MAFLTSIKIRAARKETLYQVIIGDLISLGLIADPRIKTAADVIKLLEAEEKAKAQRNELIESLVTISVEG